MFLFLIDALQLFVYEAGSETVYQAATKLSWWHRLLAPAAGGLTIGLLFQFCLTEKSPQGVADVIEATANKKGDLNQRVSKI